MSLVDHARAARFHANAFMQIGEENMKEGLHDSAAISLAMARGYLLAAANMETAVLDELADHGCTIDHRGLPAGRKCPACGAPRG